MIMITVQHPLTHSLTHSLSHTHIFIYIYIYHSFRSSRAMSSVVLLCGPPASGKSVLARAVAAAAVDSGDGNHTLPSRIVTIDESTLLPGVRDDWLSTPEAEKRLRDAVRSALERACGAQGTLVIVDAQNGIKGFRYELFCVSRAAGVRYCVVHCDVPAETCSKWNTSRDEGEDRYAESVLLDLCSRFERPDSRFRWESPLFTLHARELEALHTTEQRQKQGSTIEPAEDASTMAAAASSSAASSVRGIVDAVLGRGSGSKQLMPGKATFFDGERLVRQQQRLNQELEQKQRQARKKVIGFAPRVSKKAMDNDQNNNVAP